MLSEPVWADVELTGSRVTTAASAASSVIPFNSFDYKNMVDRNSNTGKYDVVDGFPRSLIIYIQNKTIHCRH